MAQYINTNSLSLITQNNINKNQSALSSSIERLSSGLRINSAKDDAAGQAIANRFTSNIKGLTQAARNANDGISVAQTTEGALSEINNNLQRVRELTVQASTGTNSASDLSSIQDEIKSRLSEIDRVSGQTQFNGVNVLAKDGKMSIQVGANDGETIDIDLKKIDSTTLGLNTFNVTGPVSAAGEFGKTGTATAVTDFTKYYGATTQVADATVAEKGAANDLSTRLGLGAGGAAFADDVFADDNGNLFAKVTIKATTAAESNNLKANGFDIASGAQQDFYVAIDPESADLTDPTKAAFKIDTKNLSLSSMTSGSTTDPLAKLDEAIASVDKFRSSLGAVQNRLSSAVTNLNNTTTNLSEAQSRIQDADYATELYTAEGVMDKHSLWQRYVPLVRHEALRLQVRLPASVELDDLLQAGGIGLLNAVDRYDALQGTAFTTYAVQRIRGAMLDELRSRDWVPRSVRRNAREVAHAMGQLEQELGRNATETEVAERLGIPVEEYRQMLLDTNNSQLFSYDEWREEHGDSIELVTDEHQQENPLHHLLEGNLRQRVMEAIEALPEREQLVLTLYYQEELNLKEIGAVLEVGESRVSQLHSQAIKRLRTKLGKL